MKGHNNPPSEFETLEAEINELLAEADQWTLNPVTEPEHAEGISTAINVIRKRATAAEKLRKTEKQPHLDAGKAVDAKFKPVLDRAKVAQDTLKRHLAPYIAEQERLKREAAEKARKEAEEAEQIAQEALQAAETATERAMAIEAEKAAAKMEKAAVAKSRETGAVKGSLGRAITIRRKKVAVLENLFSACLALQNEPELITVLVKLANQRLQQNQETPGFRIIEKEIIA